MIWAGIAALGWLVIALILWVCVLLIERDAQSAMRENERQAKDFWYASAKTWRDAYLSEALEKEER